MIGTEMDATTASGMTPKEVAEHVLSVIRNHTEDTLLCPLPHRIAVGLRYWAPGVLRWMMNRRAKAQASLYIKS